MKLSGKGIRFVLVGLVMVLLAGCGIERGSGNLISEPRAVRDFSSIEMSGSGTLIVEQTGAESLEVTADDNILPAIETRVVNDRLLLGLRSGFSVINSAITYRVTVDDLEAISVSGSADVELRRIDSQRLQVNLSGSGRVDGSGNVSTLEMVISGSGRFDGAELSTDTATIRISGSGRALVNAQSELNVEVSGSGVVDYIGDPQVNQRISGSGAVRKR